MGINDLAVDGLAPLTVGRGMLAATGPHLSLSLTAIHGAIELLLVFVALVPSAVAATVWSR